MQEHLKTWAIELLLPNLRGLYCIGTVRSINHLQHALLARENNRAFTLLTATHRSKNKGRLWRCLLFRLAGCSFGAWFWGSVDDDWFYDGAGGLGGLGGLESTSYTLQALVQSRCCMQY